jgi:hypothetical protein
MSEPKAKAFAAASVDAAAKAVAAKAAAAKTPSQPPREMSSQ